MSIDPALDRLAVRGIRARGQHGVFEHERRDGQEFGVDVVLGLDTRAAGRADDLAETVDYGRVSQQVCTVVEADPVDLIETLAQRVADVCLADPLVREVEVTVHKPQAPIEVPFDDVTLTIHRRRP
ncbi:MAG: dihydroneopterin aldolase [Actinomycetota bacterium]|jgi:dihydroneopterin aldolase|nr:dihydroneopterin aldolase [Propionibacteriales bacterium]MDQ3275272.1 dihydroneopterin aldolase [Actinomycetota bacterium]MDQ3422207.1 dihydroneopterin aldolase [Actinomycetota bacterium]